MLPLTSTKILPMLFLYSFAFVLTVFPLDRQLGWWRPEFITLLVIFWSLTLPTRISILAVWVVGCLQDVVEGSMLGQHALSLMVVVYVCVLSYQRVRNYTLWHQAILVFVIVGMSQLVNNWVHFLHGSGTSSLIFLLPALTSALIWPPFFIALERLRFYYRIN